MNLGFHPGILDLWRQEGCVNEVRRRLGYRFRLVDATWPSRIVLGRPWTATLRVANDGWASPYNPRLVELLFRDTATGRVVRFPVATDPRFRGPGETSVLRIDGVIPADAADGDYELLLNLPDPERGLYGVPAYSIRLANEGLWEPATGFNRLQTRVTVGPAVRERRDPCGADTRSRDVRRCGR